jgi:putative helicase MOV10L1/helicase MOV-10
MLPILRPAFTNLIRNYRSHPAILAVPSSLFYFDTLEPEAAPSTTSSLAEWDGWRGRKWPVLFHNNSSPDDLERDGGGWFNKGEVNVACAYAARLSSFLGRQQEVCIMSPFKAQVRLLRQKARSDSMALRDVNIGPTEAFQGLEHGVVILCVTRSNKRFVEKDKELSWGIIGQPNKMNVALTRAKYGLIIIGSRDVLVEDPHWRTMLDFCYRNGLVTGDTGKEEFTPREGPLTRIERELANNLAVKTNGLSSTGTSDEA